MLTTLQPLVTAMPPLGSGCSVWAVSSLPLWLEPDNGSFCPDSKGSRRPLKCRADRDGKGRLALCESSYFSSLLCSKSFWPSSCIHAHSQEGLLCYRAAFSAKSLYLICQARKEIKEEASGSKTENECNLNKKQRCFMFICLSHVLYVLCSLSDRIWVYMLHLSRPAVFAVLMSP